MRSKLFRASIPKQHKEEHAKNVNTREWKESCPYIVSSTRATFRNAQQLDDISAEKPLTKMGADKLQALEKMTHTQVMPARMRFVTAESEVLSGQT